MDSRTHTPAHRLRSPIYSALSCLEASEYTLALSQQEADQDIDKHLSFPLPSRGGDNEILAVTR